MISKMTKKRRFIPLSNYKKKKTDTRLSTDRHWRLSKKFTTQAKPQNASRFCCKSIWKISTKILQIKGPAYISICCLFRASVGRIINFSLPSSHFPGSLHTPVVVILCTILWSPAFPVLLTRITDVTGKRYCYKS